MQAKANHRPTRWHWYWPMQLVGALIVWSLFLFFIGVTWVLVAVYELTHRW
jgi:hypothetical protein